MTIGSLNNALAGLKAAQKALDVTSTNIANASTPGYTRKILPQEAIVSPNGETFGVRVQQIVRKVDLSMLKTNLNQTSVVEGLSVKQTFLERISAFHGSSDEERSISSEINRLAEQFSTLSSSPSSSLVIDQTINQAILTADKINDFSNLITQIRNDTQEDISVAVTDINNILESIAQLNLSIGEQTALGRSPAALMDQRDEALRKLSEYMEISFFARENNKITVMDSTGQVLADEQAKQLTFNPVQILPTSYYPGGGVADLFIDGTPPVNITSPNVGGKIGELINLRDNTMPQYMAQLDELAQKLASRFEEQGLRLFTDSGGNVPANVADPGLVGYVGFSADIRVNDMILDNPSLIRSGTTGATVQEGSNEIIRKIVEFTFGPYQYQDMTSTTDISAGTIFAAAGLTQSTQAIGNFDITELAALEDDPDITAGAQFTIDNGGGPTVININAADTATDLVNNINAAVGAGTARLNGLGQLVLEGTDDITVADVSLGAAGITALGLNFTTYNADNPNFTIQVGSENPLTIEIDPADTATDLLNTLNAIPNITASLDGSGALQIVPITGGDLRITDGRGLPMNALGFSVNNVPHTAFRQNNLGPDGTINTQLLATPTLEEFSQTIIAYQGEELADTSRSTDRETIFLNTLQQSYMDQSGVDLDQEVAELIRIQTAYTAAARMISASEEALDELFNAVR